MWDNEYGEASIVFVALAIEAIFIFGVVCSEGDFGVGGVRLGVSLLMLSGALLWALYA